MWVYLFFKLFITKTTTTDSEIVVVRKKNPTKSGHMNNCKRPLQFMYC